MFLDVACWLMQNHVQTISDKKTDLSRRQQMILQSLFKYEQLHNRAKEIKVPITQRSVEVSHSSSQIQQTSSSEKLPLINIKRPMNPKASNYYLANKHTPKALKPLPKAADKKNYTLPTKSDMTNTSIILEDKLPNLLEKSKSLNHPIRLSKLKCLPDIGEPPLIRHYASQPSLQITEDILQQSRKSIDNSLTKEKLAEYYTKRPESQIFNAKEDQFRSLEFKNGYYYGELDQDQQRNGYGRAFCYKLFKNMPIGVFFYFSGKVFDGSWKNDEKNGLGLELHKNEDYYQGNFEQGKPNGQGTFEWANGETYTGEWLDGFKHGNGSWNNKNGDLYEGEWRNGKVHGKGRQLWQNGDEYEGEFKESLKHGFGKEKFANGDRFVGNFKKGKASGFGEYNWSNGSVYKGNFINGLREGTGVYYNNKSEKYVGEYKKDQKSGLGEFSWSSGNIYKGNYLNDLREGYGEIFWSDGSYYKGDWEKGIQHGVGELYIQGKCHKKGLFQDNSFVKEDVKAFKEAQKNNAQKFQAKDFSNLMNKIISKLPNTSLLTSK